MNTLRTDLENRCHELRHNAEPASLSPDVKFVFDPVKFQNDERYRNELLTSLSDNNLLDLYEALVFAEGRDFGTVYGIGV